ncbi:DNA-directed DNA polymerase alpha catalytic subunit pol1, partial [Linderina macrospora]
AVVNADNDEDDVFAIKQEKDVLAEEMPAVVVTKDDEMDVDIDFADLGEDIMDAIDEKPAQPPAEPLYAEDATDKGTNWMDVQTGVGTSQPTTLSQTEAPSLATGDLCMYWLDAFEKNGNIYLFGKTPANGSYQSCCVQVSGVERNVFVLPSIDPTTGERFNALDVHKEFEKLALPIIRRFDCKPVVRKYAFEIAGVPSEAEYLKVVYSFTQPALPADMKGTTFERTFGTSYSALELFLLKRRIMGPCWLTLHNATAIDTHDRLSWCRTEFSIADPKLVKIMDDSAIEQKSLPREPPLTTMTLSLKTVMNHKAKENEVVALSMLVHRNMKLDDPKPASQRPADQYTVVRQLTGIPLPAEFSRQRGLAVEVCKTETALLNYFIALLHRADPDILISHNFYGFDLDVLLHRMRALRTDGWSKLGRLRRVQWPKMSSGGAGYAERQIVAGRVVCDTYMASKDLIRAKSYSMSSLAAQELQIKREEIPFERIPEYFATSQKLVHFLRHTAFDAFLAASLMIHLQALPLTKQLTTLAGNLWSRTLMGARAERNEFLLLHEFYRNKFIRPDKVFGKQAAVAQQQPANEDEDEQPE